MLHNIVGCFIIKVDIFRNIKSQSPSGFWKIRRCNHLFLEPLSIFHETLISRDAVRLPKYASALDEKYINLFL